jgi:hypothetical protein
MAYRKSMGENPRFFQIFEKLGLNPNPAIELKLLP